MEVYHLGRTKFDRQLTGEGARLHGGRWNVIATPCLYTSATRSLCVLEYAANVRVDELPDDLSFTVYEIPDDAWAVFSANDLPAGWLDESTSAQVREWGTRHLKQHFALKLPSVILPSEYNYLLNPLYPEFKKVRIIAVEPFTFDSRSKK